MGEHTETPVRSSAICQPPLKIDRDLTLCDPRSCDPAHRRAGVHGGEAANVRGVMLQVRARAEADFQDLAPHIGNDCLPKRSELATELALCC
jgi:hypothetical protein